MKAAYAKNYPQQAVIPKVNPPIFPQREELQRAVHLDEDDEYTFKFSEVKRGKSTCLFKPETREEYKKRVESLY